MEKNLNEKDFARYAQDIIGRSIYFDLSDQEIDTFKSIAFRAKFSTLSVFDNSTAAFLKNDNVVGLELHNIKKIRLKTGAISDTLSIEYNVGTCDTRTVKLLVV